MQQMGDKAIRRDADNDSDLVLQLHQILHDLHGFCCCFDYSGEAVSLEKVYLLLSFISMSACHDVMQRGINRQAPCSILTSACPPITSAASVLQRNFGGLLVFTQFMNPVQHITWLSNFGLHVECQRVCAISLGKDPPSPEPES